MDNFSPENWSFEAEFLSSLIDELRERAPIKYKNHIDMLYLAVPGTCIRIVDSQTIDSNGLPISYFLYFKNGTLVLGGDGKVDYDIANPEVDFVSKIFKDIERIGKYKAKYRW